MRINSYDLPVKACLAYAYTQDKNLDGSPRLSQRLTFKGHTSLEAARRSAEKLRRSLRDEHPEALLSWGYTQITKGDRMFGMVL